MKLKTRSEKQEGRTGNLLRCPKCGKTTQGRQENLAETHWLWMHQIDDGGRIPRITFCVEKKVIALDNQQ